MMTAVEVGKLETFNFPSTVYDLIGMFKSAGFEIRLVGGSVRDIILGNRPKDFDFCTNATPEQMIEFSLKYEKIDKMNVLETGLKHGTLSFHYYRDGNTYEVTSLRIDKECDGRHAEVEFTTDFKADAARRDFTMNAMSFDIKNSLFYDYFDGIKDLTNGIIRFVGDPDTRIKEDYLRIMRYYRFAGQFDLMFVDEIKKIINSNVDGLGQISYERKWSELKKILATNNVRVFTEMSYYQGVFPALGLEIDAGMMIYSKLTNVARNPLLHVVEFICNGYINADHFCDIWKVSKDERKFLKWAYEIGNIQADVKYQLLYGIPRKWLLDHIHYINGDDYELAATWEVPIMPVTGGELFDLGHRGSEISLILSLMKQDWFDSGFTATKEELLKKHT